MSHLQTLILQNGPSELGCTLTENAAHGLQSSAFMSRGLVGCLYCPLALFISLVSIAELKAQPKEREERIVFSRDIDPEKEVPGMNAGSVAYGNFISNAFSSAFYEWAANKTKQTSPLVEFYADLIDSNPMILDAVSLQGGAFPHFEEFVLANELRTMRSAKTVAIALEAIDTGDALVAPLADLSVTTGYGESTVKLPTSFISIPENVALLNQFDELRRKTRQWYKSVHGVNGADINQILYSHFSTGPKTDSTTTAITPTESTTSSPEISYPPFEIDQARFEDRERFRQRALVLLSLRVANSAPNHSLRYIVAPGQLPKTSQAVEDVDIDLDRLTNMRHQIESSTASISLAQAMDSFTDLVAQYLHTRHKNAGVRQELYAMQAIAELVGVRVVDQIRFDIEAAGVSHMNDPVDQLAEILRALEIKRSELENTYKAKSEDKAFLVLSNDQYPLPVLQARAQIIDQILELDRLRVLWMAHQGVFEEVTKKNAVHPICNN